MKVFRMKTYLGFLAMALGLVFAAGQASAGPITSRTALEALPITDFVTEDFDGEFTVTDPTGRSLLDETSLNSGTNVLGSGTGKVVDGVTFVSGERTPGTDPADKTQIQWNSTFGDLPTAFTQTISSNYSSNTIEIVFDDAVSAFGVDVGAYGFDLWDYVTVRVYGGSVDPLYTWDSQYVGSQSKRFFGYEFDDDDSGIGITSVEVSGIHGWSPLLDNVTFGTTVIPIPGAVWLLGSGLVCLVGFRKRQDKK